MSPVPDRPTSDLSSSPAARVALFSQLLIAVALVLVAGGNLDLGPDAARLGLSVREGYAPFGQVYGGYDPGIWTGRVALGQLWAWLEGEGVTAGTVRWPEAIATALTGLILARRVSRTIQPRAGVFTALAFCGTLGSIHHAAESGIDPLGTLAVVAALDRILARGPGFFAGLYAAAAFLLGGWPPLLLIGLALLVLGRPGKGLSWKVVTPVALVVLGWSIWAMQTAGVQAWAAALTLPLTRGVALSLPLWMLFYSLPLVPLAALAGWPSVRAAWDGLDRSLLNGWLQIALVAVLAGTLIPGVAPVAAGLALAGLAVLVAAVLDAIWAGDIGPVPRRTFLGAGLAIVLLWAGMALPGAGYLAAAVSYYRPVSWLVVVITLAVAAFAVVAVTRSQTRWLVTSLIGVVLVVKLFHAAIYVPEMNYRTGKGPWGRAIGQWMLPSRPIYVFHTWPADLMFYTERPARQLTEPASLKYRLKQEPAYVLLLDAEYKHWPKTAPALVKVREFSDESGHGRRVLARTEGRLPFGSATSHNGYDD